MTADNKPLIVVRRIQRGGDGRHGGAWKIAYADFVTAMMAFFLLMWLLSSTSRATREGIAEYFKTPLKVAMQRGSAVSDRVSVIQGGGKDITREEGDVRKVLDLKTAEAELEKRDRQALESLKKKIEQAIEANPTLRQFRKQLLLDITSEGLRIQIVDEQNRPMFSMASATLQPYTREILHELGQILNDVPNRVGLSGHTDNVMYAKGEKSYSNWELSADRANASRRELVNAGMQEAKLLRVVGLSSAVPLDVNNPANPINRRISIVVMNHRAERAVLGESGAAQVGSAREAAAVLAPSH